MPGIEEDNKQHDREFSRIKTALSMRMRVVSAEEKAAMEGRIGGISEIQFNPPQPLSDPALYEWVKFLDAKLDQILQLIFENKKECQMPMEVCDLSGGGMSTLSQEQFAPGDTLEISILYPFSPPQILRLYGDVLRSEKSADGYWTAVKFTMIDDSTRDKIFKLVFEKEREIIRSKRGE
ncbi:MAG: PilZ domain-containing protein [Syntrophales bacterium]|jgi:hypothetical protein|nr:PilZ domain-containing protein [Syntrophales bacterium]